MTRWKTSAHNSEQYYSPYWRRQRAFSTSLRDSWRRKWTGLSSARSFKTKQTKRICKKYCLKLSMPRIRMSCKLLVDCRICYKTPSTTNQRHQMTKDPVLPILCPHWGKEPTKVAATLSNWLIMQPAHKRWLIQTIWCSSSRSRTTPWNDTRSSL